MDDAKKEKTGNDGLSLKFKEMRINKKSGGLLNARTWVFDDWK